MVRTAANAPLLAAAGLPLFVLACAPPAAAQFSPAPANLPLGAEYRIEMMGAMWSPAQDLAVAVPAAGKAASAAGAPGAAAPRFTDVRVRLRLGRRQRIRLDYLPVRYAAGTTLAGRPPPGDGGPAAEAASTLTWNTWRLAWEHDIIHRTRGSLGLLAEAGYTDLQVVLDAPCEAAAACEFMRARRPIPAVGGVLRLYPSPAILLGAEASVLRMPAAVGNLFGYDGEQLAWDVHAALNFVEAFGLQVGYRSRDLRLQMKDQDADLRLEGVYVGALLRF